MTDQTNRVDVAEPDAGRTVPAPAGRPLSRRNTRWVLKRCGRRGHVVVHLPDDAEHQDVSERFTAAGAAGPLLRCLRCGDFTRVGEGTSGETVVGTAAEPAAWARVPLVLRGGHGRKLALLRLLAIERGLRGAVLLLAAAGIARLAGSHVAVAEWVADLEKSAEPLAQQLGYNLQASPTLAHVLNFLNGSGSRFVTLAWLLGAYGVLELVEGVGLWGGWLWAEYLAAVATAVFVPLEVYELTEKPTVLKVIALLVNVAAVFYLVWKGRLFGIRGGHRAYLAEVRDGTLLAEELAAAGHATSILSSHETL
jgi:uncharacterized membrane protein (DUF2068 family)